MTTRSAGHRSTLLAALRSGLVTALALLPSAVCELVALSRGDRAGALRWARRPSPGTRPAPVVVLGHAVLTGALGSVVWFLTGLALLGAARGPFYGFVDAGPYDHAWGGPTLAGAWAVHALVWLAVLPVWALLCRGLVVLQRALTGRLLDGRGPRWALPAALAVTAGAVVFARAWSRQLS